MQPKQTPFFSFLLALLVMLVFISGELDLIGVIMNYLFIYILAFFVPFISKEQALILLGVDIANSTYNLLLILPVLYTVIPAYANIPFLQYFLICEGFLVSGIVFSFFLALHTINKRKIRQRVGKCFTI